MGGLGTRSIIRRVRPARLNATIATTVQILAAPSTPLLKVFHDPPEKLGVHVNDFLATNVVVRIFTIGGVVDKIARVITRRLPKFPILGALCSTPHRHRLRPRTRGR
ncbi:hypothetical protein EDD25_1506 [Cryobacterium psychrophilum]|nr:hypothetical protein EDD25_1506 [Cryobacterium psychrophilum]